MKRIFISCLMLFSVIAASAEIERVPLSDFGGQIISLYGFGDYKLVQKSLAGGMIAVPFDEKGLPAFTQDGLPDFKRAKYAAVGMTRYDAMYSFLSLDPMDQLTNPMGEAQPHLVPQFF